MSTASGPHSQPPRVDPPAPPFGTSFQPPARLLALDPDLGARLMGDRLAAARERLIVPVQRLSVGSCDVSHRSRQIGLLVVQGVIARAMLLGGDRSIELIGPGDVIRPWQPETDVWLLPREVQWHVLADATVGVLDAHVVAALGGFPEIAVALLDRADRRAARLAAEKAIAHLRSVDARLVAFFWLLAERWGRRTPDGVAVPLTLSHRVLGELIGARRPTVSTSLARLARDGTLVRRPDGSWLLTGEAVGMPSRGGRRFTPLRRRLLSDV